MSFQRDLGIWGLGSWMTPFLDNSPLSVSVQEKATALFALKIQGGSMGETSPNFPSTQRRIDND